ncbi:hypothetical protein Q3P04_23220, partial [Ralstonia pseudosolanacearum]|nr:hypothetical protein [Ralstonia pseudosolanacearum]MDO3584026.1 hypothetical protein [Ralstonia pseudosolanacearum]
LHVRLPLRKRTLLASQWTGLLGAGQSNKVRSGTEQWIAEAVAAAGLLAHMEEQLITIKFVLPDASVAKASP